MLTGEVQLSSAKLMFYYLIISIVGDKVTEIIYNDEIFKPTSIQDYYISADRLVYEAWIGPLDKEQKYYKFKSVKDLLTVFNLKRRFFK